MIFEQTRGGMSKVVGIEGGAHGEGKNLTGLRILHDHGAVQGMGALQRGVERTLGHELDVFVDGQN